MTEQQVEERKGRDGGRWINARPTAAEFAEWFKDSMRIDPALEVEKYIGGVVLIPAVDKKAKYVTGFRKGVPIIEEREELIYTPYAKVEARIDYFWDLLGAHDEWVGVVERITPQRMPIDFVHTEERETEDGQPRRIDRQIRTPSAITAMEHRLPEGFSVFVVPVNRSYSYFMVCTIRVAIYNADEWRATHKDDRHALAAVRKGEGSKMVPMLKSSYNGDRVWPDDSSLMKAETGALGRALGFAGIFVIPGSGVATAEDMLESIAQGNIPSSDEAAQAPAEPATPPVKTGAEQAADEETQLSARAQALFKALKEDHPETAEEFGQWAHKRRLTKISAAKGAMLRGVVKQLERLTAEAEARTQQGAPETSSPESAEAGGEKPADQQEPTDGGPDVPGEAPSESAKTEEDSSGDAG